MENERGQLWKRNVPREGWETGWAEMVLVRLGGTGLHRPTQGTGELLLGRKGKL